MAFTFTELNTRLNNIIKEQGTGSASASDKLTTAIQEEAIEGAVHIYSNDFPRIVRASINGNSTTNYKLTGGSALTPDWSKEWSYILHDTDSGVSVGGTEKLSDTYKVTREVLAFPAAGTTTDTDQYLVFTDATAPAPGTTISFRHAAIHILNGMNSESVTTVLDVPFEALATLSAHVAAKSLSDAFGHTSDSTLTLDVTDYENKANIWLTLAIQLWKKYLRLAGLDSTHIAMESLRMQRGSMTPARVI